MVEPKAARLQNRVRWFDSGGTGWPIESRSPAVLVCSSV
jgi:hypothetical protein